MQGSGDNYRKTDMRHESRNRGYFQLAEHDWCSHYSHKAAYVILVSVKRKEFTPLSLPMLSSTNLTQNVTRMHKEEYHLLYVLSEPPISVAQKKAHGWISGDVLVSASHPTCASSDRFLVLDVNQHGRVMALKLSEMSTVVDKLADYVEMGPKGLDLFEPDLVSCTCLIVSHQTEF
jgi:hypothetical protein